MVSTILCWWSIGLFIMLCFLLTPSYTDALGRVRLQRGVLLSSYVVHLSMAIIWPFVLFVVATYIFLVLKK